MDHVDVVQTTQVGDRTEIRLVGHLGVSEAAAAQRRLDVALAQQRPVSLDATKLNGVDTAGLQLLAAFYRAAHLRELNPQWIEASAALREGARLLGLEALLNLEPARNVQR